MTLRPYQKAALEQIRAAFKNHKRVLFVLPTGGGKTAVFAETIRLAIAKDPTAKCLVIVHGKDLAAQIVRTLNAQGVPALKFPEHKPAQGQASVALIQYFARKDLSGIGRFKYVVVDEAHHACAATYRHLFDALGDAYVLGATATPIRTDGQGLGDVFDEMVLGPSISELIRQGHIADYVYYAPKTLIDERRADDENFTPKATVFGDVYEQWRKHFIDKRSLVYCTSVAHARQTQKLFASRGVPCLSLDGQTKDEERKKALDMLAEGIVPVIASCNILSEGIDVPAVDGVILLRPTQSLSVYLQQVGRALRPAPGKDNAVILDLAGNVFRHGLPDDERRWTLDGVKKRGDAGKKTLAALCHACFAAFPPHKAACPHCGAERLRKERAVKIEKEAEIIEITRTALALPYFKALELLKTKEQLKAYAKAKNYRRGWVAHRLREMKKQS